jgi:hypothetical protein
MQQQMTCFGLARVACQNNTLHTLYPARLLVHRYPSCCAAQHQHAAAAAATNISVCYSCRYAEYDVLRPLLHKHLQYSDSILVLGPGTSALHEQLYERYFLLAAEAADADVQEQ